MLKTREFNEAKQFQPMVSPLRILVV